MKLFRENEVGTLLDELYDFIADLQKGKTPTKPRLPKGIDATKIIKEIEDLHPYKQSGNIDSYGDYNQGWSDACDVILSRLEDD